MEKVDIIEDFHKTEQRMLSDVAKAQMETREVAEKVVELEIEIVKLKAELRKQVLMADHQGEDEEKDEMRRIIAQKDMDIAEIERGIPLIVEENRRLAARVETVAE